MGLYAWHECVHDEEEAGAIDLGISLGEALLDFRLAFFFSFSYRPSRGRIWHVVVGYGMDTHLT